MSISPTETTAPISPDRRRARRKRAVAGGLVLTVLVGAALVVNYGFDYQLPGFPRWSKRFAAVEEGVLYRSAQPEPRHIRNLVKYKGLRTLLIVREGESPSVAEEKALAAGLGLKVVHIPIPSRQRLSDEHIRAFFDCVDNPANQPVLVHCSAGRHRTGYLCARYRIDRQGWTVDRAIEELLSFGFDVENHAMILDQLQNYHPADSILRAAPVEIRR